MRHLISVALTVAVPVMVACNNGGTSSATSPSVVLTTETFTGTVEVGGSDFHNFTVAQGGPVSITLTAAGPPPTIFMGLGIGNGGTSCALISGGSTPTPAGPNPQLSGNVATGGTLCVEVYDIGNQLGPVDYTVVVSHP
jgi:hypothetical protein